MKKLILSLGLLMVTVLSVPSFALTGSNSSNKTLVQVPLVAIPGAANGSPVAFITATTNGQAVQFCGGSATGAGGASATGYLVSCGMTPITGINISGGASGGTVAIYDAATNNINQAFPAEVGSAETVFEATVAANTQNFYDLHDAPINTQNGVVVMASSTSGVVVYSSPAVAANH
jgi:hypothetical protein